MNGKVSVCVICVKAIIYLLLNNMHDCAFRLQKTSMFGINTTALNRINGKLAFFLCSLQCLTGTTLKVSPFGVFLVRIQSKCGKIWTRKTPTTNTFHAVEILLVSFQILSEYRELKIRSNSFFKLCQAVQVLKYLLPYVYYGLKINHDISNVGQPHTFPPGKIY